jgi:DeoR/GlpR family transcriptional regulator of sugar metabolism
VINRGQPLIRQWKLLRLVAASRYMTVAVLADQLACSTKTVRRDLLVLESAGFPLEIGGTPQYNHVRIEKGWMFGAEPLKQMTIRELEKAQRST